MHEKRNENSRGGEGKHEMGAQDNEKRAKDVQKMCLELSVICCVQIKVNEHPANREMRPSCDDAHTHIPKGNRTDESETMHSSA